MPTAMPMLADFSIRLVGGILGMLFVLSSREVPLAFFRTHCLVALGLLVGASLSEGSSVPMTILVVTMLGAFLSYLASACWGLGLPRVAIPLTGLVVAIALGLMGWMSFATRSGIQEVSWFNAASRLASSLLMGSTLTAMLLGHHYLTAPAMTIRPLRGLVAIMAVALVIRTVLASLALGLHASSPAVEGDFAGPMFLGMRWGMGILGPALATTLTWKTVQIRSTQSATGILYIAMTLVLFGELTGLILGRSSGIEF